MKLSRPAELLQLHVKPKHNDAHEHDLVCIRIQTTILEHNVSKTATDAL